MLLFIPLVNLAFNLIVGDVVVDTVVSLPFPRKKTKTLHTQWMRLQFSVNTIHVSLWNHKGCGICGRSHQCRWVIVIVIEDQSIVRTVLHLIKQAVNTFPPLLFVALKENENHVVVVVVLSSSVVEAGSKHFQHQLLPQHHSVPCWTCRLDHLHFNVVFGYFTALSRLLFKTTSDEYLIHVM